MIWIRQMQNLKQKCVHMHAPFCTCAQPMRQCYTVTYRIGWAYTQNEPWHLHISGTKWCIVGYLSNALWDLCKRSKKKIHMLRASDSWPEIHSRCPADANFLFPISMLTFMVIIVAHGRQLIILLRPEQNGRHFADVILKSIFVNEN